LTSEQAEEKLNPLIKSFAFFDEMALRRTIIWINYEERARQAARECEDRGIPLEDRLVKLLADIPAEVQREGLSLPCVVPNGRRKRRR
jgi:hypothetical protein